MKLTTITLTITALSFTAISFTSCSEKQKPNETVYENTDEQEASPVAKLVTKNTEAMGNLATQLEGISDLETAKVALPELAKAGAKFARLKLDTFKAGGSQKLQKFMKENPDAKKKYLESVEKVKIKMEQLKKDHPAAEVLIRDYVATLFK